MAQVFHDGEHFVQFYEPDELLLGSLGGYGDAGRLQQVVWNLLSNAIKFTEEGGTVCVRLGRAGRDVEVLVSDDGCGIEADAHAAPYSARS